MKGLLIKDLCLLKGQKKILPVYLFLAIWFTAMHNDAFSLPFLMMMASILTVSTISYDEFDRSWAHLFTMPFDRRTYVLEKFVLGGILAAASLVLSAGCMAVRFLISPGEAPADVGMLILLSACAGTAMIAVMVPIRIRFGGDRGRLVLFAVFGVISLVPLLLSRVLPVTRDQITDVLSRLSTTAVLLSALGAAAVLTAAGLLLGVYWIERKEF